MTYDIYGSILTDPTLTIFAITWQLNEQVTRADIYLVDSTGADAPIILEAQSQPVAWTIEDVEAWIWVELQTQFGT